MTRSTAPDMLAVHGGVPTVHSAPPYVWPRVTPGDAQEIAEMAMRGEVSYYGREGYAERLEDQFKARIGRTHALATSSGTAALHSAFFALGLGPGDEVLAPAYTFFATVMPLFVVNAVPVLVDVDPLTGNVDLAKIESEITPRTRAIVVVHLWGNPVDMDAVMRIASDRGLKVVEDCSHAHGASCNGKPAGSFGDVAVFSLQGKKAVSAGQGGILCTDSREIFERAVLLGHFNVRAMQDVTSDTYRRYTYTGMGLNYRIHPFAAAMAVRHMDRLEQVVAARNLNFSFLSSQLEGIPGIIVPPVDAPGGRHAYYSYKLIYRSDQLGGLRIERFTEAVQAEGVPLVRYDPPPLHLLDVFGDGVPPFLSHGPDRTCAPSNRRTYCLGDRPGAERYADELMSLPAYCDDVRDSMKLFAAAIERVARHADVLM
jgi:perosamine synthetase